MAPLSPSLNRINLPGRRPYAKRPRLGRSFTQRFTKKAPRVPLIELLTYLAVVPLVVFILMTTIWVALLLFSARPAHPPATVHIRRLAPLPAYIGSDPAEIRLIAPAGGPEAAIPKLDRLSGVGANVPPTAPPTTAAAPGSAFFEALLQQVKPADMPAPSSLTPDSAVTK